MHKLYVWYTYQQMYVMPINIENLTLWILDYTIKVHQTDVHIYVLLRIDNPMESLGRCTVIKMVSRWFSGLPCDSGNESRRSRILQVKCFVGPRYLIKLVVFFSCFFFLYSLYSLALNVLFCLNSSSLYHVSYIASLTKTVTTSR